LRIKQPDLDWGIVTAENSANERPQTGRAEV
jgi:hypothetical protein